MNITGKTNIGIIMKYKIFTKKLDIAKDKRKRFKFQ
jgi:hypothetical protein